MSFRSKRNLALISAGVIAGISILSVEPAKDFVKSMPGTMEILALVHNGLNRPLSPDEAGDGSQADEILLVDPAGVARDPEGNVYISDRVGLIWKIDSTKIARVIAGTGLRGRARAGRSADETDLGVPQGIAFGSRNRLHIADSINNVVLRIESDGTLHRVAGTGFVGNQGDGGPAMDAELDEPYDIRFDSEDNLFIVEFGSNRIRKVDQQGIISTVAGTGEAGYSGDGGPATSALLRGPYGAFLDSKDRLYIADSGNHVIRMIDDNGIISTIAGSIKRGYAGDDGPATDALMDSPQFLAIDEIGRTFIGDEHNRAIRMITADGMISTLIGSTTHATQDQSHLNVQEGVLSDPEALLLQADDSLLIVDGGNARVIRLHSDGAIEHFAGRVPAKDASNSDLN